jgi:hypothetical protein
MLLSHELSHKENIRMFRVEMGWAVTDLFLRMLFAGSFNTDKSSASDDV